MSRKAFVIDTNVLLHDPEALLKFPGNDVVVPLTVLEELDQMKRLPNELGKNSRAVIRLLVGLKGRGEGDLHSGVSLQNGAKVWVQVDTNLDGDLGLPYEVNDNKIILGAHLLKEKGQGVVFVTKDFAARIKAEAVGLESKDYENLKVSYDNIYKGINQIELSKAEIDQFYKDSKLERKLDANANEFFVMKGPESSSAIAKYSGVRAELEPLVAQSNLWGVQPKNAEQRCAVDLLLRDEIRLVSLIGQAGTGKTLLSLACGLRKVFDENKYNKILISRPIVPLGRDIGYLPGSKEEKLFHWMQPIYDNLEFLCASAGGEGVSETLSFVMESKKIEMEAVTYIRGRSLPRMYIIIDEAQNLTPHEVKTIISRAGEETKVILVGDPTQIDNPYLDKDSNGLTYMVERFKGQPIYGHVMLEKTERSELAALAADIL